MFTKWTKKEVLTFILCFVAFFTLVLVKIAEVLAISLRTVKRNMTSYKRMA